MEEFSKEKAQELLERAETWGRANLETTLTARREASHALSIIGAFSLGDSPLSITLAPMMAESLKACFELGYYLGRTYQDVPKVFKEALK